MDEQSPFRPGLINGKVCSDEPMGVEWLGGEWLWICVALRSSCTVLSGRNRVGQVMRTPVVEIPVIMLVGGSRHRRRVWYWL